jgi:hypothetical protein
MIDVDPRHVVEVSIAMSNGAKTRERIGFYLLVFVAVLVAVLSLWMSGPASVQIPPSDSIESSGEAAGFGLSTSEGEFHDGSARDPTIP